MATIPTPAVAVADFASAAVPALRLDCNRTRFIVESAAIQYFEVQNNTIPRDV